MSGGRAGGGSGVCGIAKKRHLGIIFGKSLSGLVVQSFCELKCS